MFVACGIWFLAGVSSVSPSSEETLTLETSAKHHIPRAKNIPYQPLLIKPIFLKYCLITRTKTDHLSSVCSISRATWKQSKCGRINVIQMKVVVCLNRIMSLGVIALVYFNKIISLPAPLLYCVYDCFVLLHKNPNICRFYPYFSMLFRFSICQLFCTPNGMTAEPEYYRRTAKVKERMGGKPLSGCKVKISLANQVAGNTMAIVF